MKKRLTMTQEEALAVLEAMEGGEYESDDWEYAKGPAQPVHKPGHQICVDYDNETAHRMLDRARKRGDMSFIDLIRVYVEQGLDADDAAEAVTAKESA